MASVTDLPRPALSDRLRAALQRLREDQQKRRVFRQTVRELEALRDRDLADLGIARSDIPALARQHAEGA